MRRALLDLVANGPILAREFSDRAHALGLEGKELGRAKLAAEIETFKGPDGRWYCRHVPGYEFKSAAQELGIDSGVLRSLAFQRMSAVAAAQDHPIGHGVPRQKPEKKGK